MHHELIGHLHDCGGTRPTPPSSETSALALLALAVGLDRHLFPLSDRQAIRTRLREIATECADGSWVGAAVAGAVNAMDAAIGITPGSVAFL